VTSGRIRGSSLANSRTRPAKAARFSQRLLNSTIALVDKGVDQFEPEAALTRRSHATPVVLHGKVTFARLGGRAEANPNDPACFVIKRVLDRVRHKLVDDETSRYCTIQRKGGSCLYLHLNGHGLSVWVDVGAQGT